METGYVKVHQEQKQWTSETMARNEAEAIAIAETYLGHALTEESNLWFNKRYEHFVLVSMEWLVLV